MSQLFLDFQSDISTIETKGNTTKVMSSKKSSKSQTAKKPLNPTELNSLAKVKWSSLQTDLKSAMGDWSELDQQPAAKSPEEEQFEKVKTLIEDLKLKLNDF